MAYEWHGRGALCNTADYLNSRPEENEMPAFPKPKFDFQYQADKEIGHLRSYRDTEAGRQIPAKSKSHLLLATWNIANLGQHERRTKDYRLLAEVISWFDLVAIQECKEDLSGLRAIQEHLPGWNTLFTDASGNNERMACLYDAKKVALMEEIGEIAIPEKDLRFIKLPGVTRKFQAFDRNPAIASFKSGKFEFVLVNCHFFYGSETTADVNRRALEAFAVARWGDLRTKTRQAYTQDVIVLGDLNMPKAEKGDPIYTPMNKRGLVSPPHSTRIASSIASDNQYDQVMFFPGETGDEFTDKIGVFDFDGSVFPTLWENRTAAQFRSYVRYYLSDHRPLWAQFKI
jgi:endonuclease/exonuclease/phosphatase family metal-dependent hydrolase